jgi:hypothetical protein
MLPVSYAPHFLVYVKSLILGNKMLARPLTPGQLMHLSSFSLEKYCLKLFITLFFANLVFGVLEYWSIGAM